MLRLAISLRYIMLIASVGTALGALLMLWQGCLRMLSAAGAIFEGQDTRVVIPLVMGGTDAFLFGLVLVIFAYAIAFGFVFDLSPEQRRTLPSWMRVEGVHELKNTLVGVILVYLVVDFATDWPEVDSALTWEMLVKPVSIFLIAAAFYLFAGRAPEAAAPHAGR
jgi:uncharacterized membrane protein YqhA